MQSRSGRQRGPLEAHRTIPAHTTRVVWDFSLQDEKSVVIVDGHSDADAAGCRQNATLDIWRLLAHRATMYLVREEGEHWVVRCTSTTVTARPLRSSGRIGQARWWRFFSRTGSSGEWHCDMTMGLLCQETRDACWDSSETLGSPCSL